MKSANPALLTSATFAVATQAQILPREKLRFRENSPSDGASAIPGGNRALRKDAELESMSFSMAGTIGALADEVDAAKRSSKSGKGSAIAPTDYSWLVGNYSKCTQTLIFLFDGVPFLTTEDDNCTGSRALSIDSLGGSNRMFQSTLRTEVAVPCSAVNIPPPNCPNKTLPDTTSSRHIFEGVGSYNPMFENEMIFHTDHQDVLEIDDDGKEVWVPQGDSTEQDKGTLTCSQLENYPGGSTIVCDLYENSGCLLTQCAEYIASFIFSEE